jgi:heme-degrading monooxygenase HmoA
VVSRWENRANWEVWFNTSEKAEIQNKIDKLTEEKTEHTVCAPIVPGQEFR